MVNSLERCAVNLLMPGTTFKEFMDFLKMLSKH